MQFRSAQDNGKLKQGAIEMQLGMPISNNTKNDDGNSPKNGMKGMQQMMQLHTVYSLVNQLKQQSMDIKELKQILARNR